MVSVRKFAEQVSCTPQNIYKHLKTHAEALEGHTEKGTRGVLLDDYACDYLRSVMYPKEISADTEVMEELNKLRANLLQLGMENARLSSQLVTVEAERDRALLEARSAEKSLLQISERVSAQESELTEAKADVEKLEQVINNLTDTIDVEKKAKEEYERQIIALKGRNFWQRLTRQGE